MENIKNTETSTEITGTQLFWIVTNVANGMALLLTYTPVFKDAHQDAWISMLLGTILAVVITYVSSKVSLMYPNQTLVQYSQTILGKWFGRLAVVPFFLAWYTVTPVVMRQSSEAVKQLLLPRTPLIVIILPLVGLAMYLTYQGIQIIARANEMVGPAIYLTVIAVVVLLLRELRWSYVLPIYPTTGIVQIARSSLTPASFMGESIIIVMLVPLLVKPNQLVKKALYAVITAGVALSAGAVVIAGVLSPAIAAKLWYPAFEAAKFISIGDFVQNLDAIITVIWLSAAFLKIGVYFYLLCFGTAQFFGIKNWRRTIWFVGPVMAVMSLIPQNMIQVNVWYPSNVWVPYVLPIDMLIIPCSLWLIGTLRKKVGQKPKSRKKPKQRKKRRRSATSKA